MEQQYKLVRLGVDVLLSQSDVRDALDGHSQAKVQTPQEELRPILYAAGDRSLADQSPLVSHPALRAVLQGRTRGQVRLEERLDTQKQPITQQCSLFKGYFQFTTI